MGLYFITGSKHKFAEVKAILPEVEQLEIDLNEIQELDQRKIISAKIFEARRHYGNAYVVEDTSLYLDALNGLPGPLIKWFMKTIGCDGLYKIAQAFGNYDVVARTIVGYADGKGAVEFFEGEIKGTVVAPRGASKFGQFGWDPIFQPEGYTQTFAEMGERKNEISMRRLAVEKLKNHLHRGS